MDKHIFFNSDSIKIKLLDWLIKKNKTAIFANELLFSKNRRRADLVGLSKKILTAFEIKSNSDNTSKLDNQIEDYIRTFDKVFIITTKKNLNQILIKTKKTNIGIILYDTNFKIIKRATKNIPRKQDLLCLLDKNTLLKELKLKKSNLSTDKIRKIAMKNLTLQDIKKLSYNKIYLRYAPLFKLFIRDRSNNATTFDDLLNLTGIIERLR
jgi:hypothetical protein